MTGRREELLKELENSVGERIYTNLRALERAYQTFKKNFLELQEAINAIGEIEDQGTFDPSIHQDAVLEMTVRFHNFVVSTKTVYETTTTVRNQDFSEEMEAEYKRRVQQVDLHPQRGEFMKCLRNYTQHRHIPPVETKESRSIVEKLRGKDPEVTVFLDKHQLLDASEFNEKARSYIENMDTVHVDILTESEDYYQEIVEINNWMTGFYMDEYREALDRRDNLIRELRSV